MKLADYMEKNDIGVNEMARLCGVHKSVISRVKLGKGRPSARNLNRISGATGGEVGYTDLFPEVTAPCV